jgi:hypothetical protein
VWQQQLVPSFAGRLKFNSPYTGIECVAAGSVRQLVTSVPQARDDLSLAAARTRRHGLRLMSQLVEAVVPADA